MPGRRSSGAHVVPELTTPAAPPAGSRLIYPKADGRWYTRDSSNVERVVNLAQVDNASVAAQSPAAATDTYLTGTGCTVPTTTALRANSKYHARLYVSKTAAGVAAPIFNIRFGTAGTVADASRAALTLAAQTAAADEGVIDIYVTFRAVGASGVIAATVSLTHKLAATGLSVENASTRFVAGAAFDTTPAASIIGVSVNTGASAAWTVQMAQAELFSLNP